MGPATGRRHQQQSGLCESRLYLFAQRTSASITGADFYTGTQFPTSYQGKYFFADYVQGFIRTLDINTGSAADFATSVNIPVDIDMAPDGGLYWLSLGPGSGTNGEIYKITYTAGNHPPSPSRPPIPLVEGGAVYSLLHRREQQRPRQRFAQLQLGLW